MFYLQKKNKLELSSECEMINIYIYISFLSYSKLKKNYIYTGFENFLNIGLEVKFLCKVTKL